MANVFLKAFEIKSPHNTQIRNVSDFFQCPILQVHLKVLQSLDSLQAALARKSLSSLNN